MSSQLHLISVNIPSTNKTSNWNKKKNLLNKFVNKRKRSLRTLQSLSFTFFSWSHLETLGDKCRMFYSFLSRCLTSGHLTLKFQLYSIFMHILNFNLSCIFRHFLAALSICPYLIKSLMVQEKWQSWKRQNKRELVKSIIFNDWYILREKSVHFRSR